MSQFLSTLNREHQERFTGVIRLLNLEDSRDLGQVEIKEGEITNCRFLRRKGYNGLLSAAMAFLDIPFKIVKEPEINISESKMPFRTEKLLSNLGKASNYYESKKHLKPPMNLKMTVNPDFMNSKKGLQGHEFDLLCAISDFGHTAEIYENSELFDHEITLGLIKLREKKAIKVVR